jgi:hypothetical protein
MLLRVRWLMKTRRRLSNPVVDIMDGAHLLATKRRQISGY